MTESSFREIMFDRTDQIDVQVRNDAGETRVFIGRGSSVITIPYDKLDEFVAWLVMSARELNDQLINK